MPAAKFITAKCFNEIFRTGFGWMVEGDGIVVHVLQTKGLVNYLYYLTPSKELEVKRVGADPTKPLVRVAADGFPKWNDTVKFGTDVARMRAHLKNTMKNGHGEVERYRSKINQTERYYPISNVSFVEPQDYFVPELQAVPPATKRPLVIPQEPKRRQGCPISSPETAWMWWGGLFLLIVALAALAYYTKVR